MGETITIHRRDCSEGQPMEGIIRSFDSKRNMVLDRCPECKVEVLKGYEATKQEMPTLAAERG